MTPISRKRTSQKKAGKSRSSAIEVKGSLEMRNEVSEDEAPDDSMLVVDEDNCNTNLSHLRINPSSRQRPEMK